MIETPEIIEASPQRTATIQILCAADEVRNVMGPGLRELGEVLGEQGIPAAGPWFTHHFRRPSDTFDFEICIPVAAVVRPERRVTAGELPGSLIARTLYQGSYQGLPAAWRELQAWIVEQGHKPAQDLWEKYLAGPDSSADPARWRTELCQPLL